MTEANDTEQLELARLAIGCAWFAIVLGVACSLLILAIVIGIVVAETVSGGAA